MNVGINSVASTNAIHDSHDLHAANRRPLIDRDGDRQDDRVEPQQSSGGQLQQALAEALQGLGMPLPATTSPTAATPPQRSERADADSSSQNTSLRQDLHQFVHELFQALRQAGSPHDSAPATSAASSDSAPPVNLEPAPKPRVASNLSALISQVSSGSVPPGLQSAYAKLVTDLQPSGSVADSGNTTPPTLQELLTRLQQNLGYGATALDPSGNLVDTMV
jgi:hypothetical protein